MKIHEIFCKLKKYVINPDYRFIINDGLGLYKKMDDIEFTKKKFKARMGYELDLNKPSTFNEKLQWLKLYDHKPEYTRMVDKFEAKEYVRNIIGDEYIIPTLGVWEKAEDIEWKKLPNKFVLKVTHDSGGLVICRDKSHLDIPKVIKKLNDSLEVNYYLLHREWAYKNVHKRIIAEQFMQNGDQHDLRDYKFYCFNGEPKFIYISEGLENHKTAKLSFLTMDWEFAPFGREDFQAFSVLPEKPDTFEEMVEIARKLSQGHPFLRVDLYSINGKVYFGELTFCPCAGMMKFVPAEYDEIIGMYVQLPLKDD